MTVPNINNILIARSVSAFAPYYQVLTARDVQETIALRQLTGLDTAIPDNTLRPPTPVVNLVQLILDTSEGGVPVYGERGMLTQLNNLQSGVQPAGFNPANHFQLYYASPTITAGTYDPNSPRLSSPLINNMLAGRRLEQDAVAPWRKCSIFKVMSPWINPTNQNSEALSIYLNGIPTLEFAKCVPYIDIKLISNRSSTDEEGRPNALSIIKLIDGASSNLNNAAKAMVAANEESGKNIAGIELFTTPATLTSIGPFDRSVRTVPVLDPHRPFLMFKSLMIDVAPSTGFFSFKTGKLEFTLTDRSRFHEIADFVRPDLYSTTDLEIEYGWMHPDEPDRNNYYANLLNATRSREKYMIRNASYTIGDDSQVNVTVDIAMKGATSIFSQTINGAGSRTLNTISKIRRICEHIRAYRADLNASANRTQNNNNNSSRSTQEIRGIQIVDAASDENSVLRMDQQNRDQLREFMTLVSRTITNSNNTRIGQSLRNLQRELRELYGSGTGGSLDGGTSVGTLRNDVRTEVQDILRAIMTNPADTSADPMLPPPSFQVPSRRNPGVLESPFLHLHSNVQTINEPNSNVQGRVSIPAIVLDQNLTTNQHRQYVSLATLLLHFVAIPLANSGNFEEVQMLFYPFNECAGYAHSLTTGQFVVDLPFFLEQYVRYRTESLNRAANINLEDFISFLQNTIIDDPLAMIYGIDTLYQRRRNRQDNTTTVAPISEDVVTHQSNLERLLAGVTPNAEFKIPHIECYAEALPIKGDLENGKTILRLHFVDRQASSYQAQGAILSATRNTTINMFSGLPSENRVAGEQAINESRRVIYNNIINLAIQDNVIQPVQGSSNPTVYELKGGPSAIKNFVMKTMPYVLFGIQGTAVKTANLSSIQDATLSSVNMLRSFNASPLRANGEQPGGLPMSIIPAELSMTTIGCNLFHRTQQIFIDFNTGTTVDNIYGVNGIVHKIEPGLFETEVKFVYLDAYGRYNSFMEQIRQASVELARRNAE